MKTIFGYAECYEAGSMAVGGKAWNMSRLSR